jgi:hypothetical protein
VAEHALPFPFDLVAELGVADRVQGGDDDAGVFSLALSHCGDGRRASHEVRMAVQVQSGYFRTVVDAVKSRSSEKRNVS